MEPGRLWAGDPTAVYGIIEEVERAGITVALTGSENEHYAVIDKRLVWHGGGNLLGKEDVWDNPIRAESSKAAAELLEMSCKGIDQSAQ